MRTTKLINFNDMSDYASDLICPRCGGTHLIHTGVTIYDRKEDEDEVTKIEVRNVLISKTKVSNSVSGNPSGRRDGLAIQFYCEECSPDRANDVIELTIAQHKGSTEMAWRFSPLT